MFLHVSLRWKSQLETFWKKTVGEETSISNFGCPCAQDHPKNSPANQKYWCSCPPKLTFIIHIYFKYSKYGQPEIVTWLSLDNYWFFLNSNTRRDCGSRNIFIIRPRKKNVCLPFHKKNQEGRSVDLFFKF